MFVRFYTMDVYLARPLPHLLFFSWSFAYRCPSFIDSYCPLSRTHPSSCTCLINCSLQFCTPDDVVELKGRVACEISTGDELLLTEMIFNGIFNELTTAKAVALLSCFVAGGVVENKNRTPSKMAGDELAEPLRLMHVSVVSVRLADSRKSVKLYSAAITFAYA